jgi:hypothetical protein
MKVFKDNESSWFTKVNFVDENNVYVGYDLGQDCCEHADWFITDQITPYDYRGTDGPENAPNIEDYHFDKEFFQNVESKDLDAGTMIVFRLISEGKPDLYLHLFNCHNGYYGHGFEVKHGGEIVRDGTL